MANAPRCFCIAAQAQRIRQLSLAQTEALVKVVLDFQTAANLTAWLAAPPESPPNLSPRRRKCTSARC
ncbi:MAG: DUF4351 domain-containing protein [Candidatus Contendobacter sp.]|nr:DUF4351 domain-containing protein [Candidatus Contendobacter sp.]MDS4057223.1 DUF4351 domain-containing protein [Candidatus Contendobacter sp.]